jgi:ABC-2 type transport system permease protein
MFMAVGAVCAQLAATRRQAAAMAAAVFGVAYLIRLIAYSSTSLTWLHWASPLGWVDELRPLTDSKQLPLIPIVGTVAVLAAATIMLAGNRDLGASVLPARDTATARTRLLTGPFGLAARLGQRSAVGWVGGLAAGGFVLGLTVKATEGVWADQSGGFAEKLGGAAGGAAYLGITFLVVTLVVAMAADRAGRGDPR